MRKNRHRESANSTPAVVPHLQRPDIGRAQMLSLVDQVRREADAFVVLNDGIPLSDVDARALRDASSREIDPIAASYSTCSTWQPRLVTRATPDAPALRRMLINVDVRPLTSE